MLESAELNRQQSFISDEIKKNFKDASAYYGVIRNKYLDPSFLNYKVESGTNVGTIKIANDSTAMDKDGLAMLTKAFDNYAIPNDGHDYYVTIKHQYSPLEEGTCSISSDGTLSGVGTAFTEVLRGQPHFASKIKFYDTVANTGEYTVVEVVNNTSVLLAGGFTPETDLRYAVIGTFTPTALIPTANKEIFQYDSCLVQVIQDTAYLASLPLTAGKEFTIAKVFYDTGVIAIEDLRREIYITDDKAFVDEPISVINPVVGVESIKWDNQYGTKERNELNIAWGFRSTNFTIESTSRTMTILSGEGGRFKTSNDFSTGEFDGWRIYNKEGNYKRIISSTKVASSIKIVIESLDVYDYPLTDQILIVPDVEEVLIKARPDGAASNIEQLNQEFKFAVNTDVAKVWLLVAGATSYLYNISVRYKRFNRYSDRSMLPEDTVGFYDETSYDSNGVLNVNPVDRNRVPYTPPVSPSTDGYIKLLTNPSAYYPLITSVITGDRYGVDRVVLDPAITQPYNLVVGANRMYQHFEGSFSLVQDFFINLDTAGAINGNTFILRFAHSLSLNGFNLRIVTNYVDPLTYDQVDQIDIFDEAYMSLGSGFPVEIWFRFDGTVWEVKHSTYDRNYDKWQGLLIAGNTSNISANSALIAAINAWQNNIDAAWVTEAITSANVSLTGATLANVSGSQRYKIIGKTMHVCFSVTLDIGGAPSAGAGVEIDIPNGGTRNTQCPLSASSIALIPSLGDWEVYKIISGSSGKYAIKQVPTGGTYAADTGYQFNGQFVIEIN